ncbi:MAG: hypothetical protein KDK70_24035, partial [Myxococcales bacterium]|nr:hypothetical protein [Myxococcales bacterium]
MSPPEHDPDEPSEATLPGLLASIAQEHLARDHAQPVRPARTAEALAEALSIELDGRPRPWPQTLDLLREVLAATPSTTSRRFFNQLFGGRDAVATLGEVAAALTNSPMHTFKASGVQVLVERAVLRRMGALAGMPHGDGMLAPGGSLSNLAALLLARDRALPEAREAGLPGIRAAVYTSAEGHYSIRKAAGMAGLGRSNVRMVPVDEAGCMRPGAL